MQSNFLVQNDPILVALLALGPWTILLVSILVQVAVPGMFAYFGHAWRDSDIEVPADHQHPSNGHGFIRFNNLYVLIFPLLNLAIFWYYEQADRSTRALVESGVKLQLGTDDVIAMISEPFLALPWSLGFYLVYAIGLGVTIYFIWFQGRIKIESGEVIESPSNEDSVATPCEADGNAREEPKGNKRYILRTDWLYQDGRPKLTAYIFGVTTHWLQISLLLGWISRHVVLTQMTHRKLLFDDEIGARLIPFHVDGMFGLSSLQALSVTTSIVIVFAGLVVAFWVLGMVETWGGWRNAVRTPGPIVGIVAFLLFGPAMIVLVLGSGHSSIVETKAATLTMLHRQVVRVSDSLENAAVVEPADPDHIEKLVKQKDQLESLYRDVAGAPNWPLSLSSGAAFALFLNLLVPPLGMVIAIFIYTKAKVPPLISRILDVD